LDLTLVVPFLALAAVWLWRGDPWGAVLATILCVKGTIHMLALDGDNARGRRCRISGSGSGGPDLRA
jgi:hypothetical protein